MNTNNEKVFASHVGAKLTKANGLGIKASWTTADHLTALADAIVQAIATGTGESKDAVRDVLGECYNVSAYQQLLAKRFEKLGHFQREKVKAVSEQLDDELSKLIVAQG